MQDIFVILGVEMRHCNPNDKWVEHINQIWKIEKTLQQEW